MPSPLSGVRVLELTTIILGPWGAQLLGDMGADVIKVESPDGDPMRDVGPRHNQGMAAVYLNVNRNKRSLVLDLKQAPARDALLRLVEGTDVFLHAMRPPAIARPGPHLPRFGAAECAAHLLRHPWLQQKRPLWGPRRL